MRWSRGQKKGISFDLYPGEIVGMAGLMGAGRTEVAQTVFGARRRLAGSIEVDGKPRNIRWPAPRDSITHLWSPRIAVLIKRLVLSGSALQYQPGRP